MNKIIIVDDDPNLRELVHTFLQNNNFAVIEAEDGIAALEKLETTKVELAILDIMMPKMDGFELCRQIREYYDIPVLMLTAKGETAQKVKGFNLGADDYLVKPFEPIELVMRVKALLNRYQIMASQNVQIGQLRLNKKKYEINTDTEQFTLPLKEYELLFKLSEQPGRTFSRDELIEDIWGYDFNGNERTLDVHINRLRQRFPNNKYGFQITTIRGLGYRLEVNQ